LVLAALVFFHDSATNLVGAIRDIEGDRIAGCPTVPVVYGLARAVEIVCALVVCWVALGGALLALVRPNALALGLFIVAVALAASVYIPLWMRRAALAR